MLIGIEPLSILRKLGGSRPVVCFRKDILFSGETGKWGGSLRASAYCHGAKCSMTILLLPESWGKENVLRILNVWILNIDTTQKIILLIGEDPFISREEMAKLCRVTSDAIKAQIRKLRRSGRIRRIGPDKGDVGK